MHTSLDDFVAGPNGEIDWVKVDEEIFEYINKLTDQSVADRDGMAQSEMERGVNETYERLNARQLRRTSANSLIVELARAGAFLSKETAR